MCKNIQHLVMFSGGVGSWAAAKRVAMQHGTENMTLLFADTKMEDEDLYRFIDEAAENIGAPLVKIAEGRDPWEVFFDVRFLGNSRLDPCSKILKRGKLDEWRNKHCNPDTTTIYIGYDIREFHRLKRLQKLVAPWRYLAPMTEKPFMLKKDMLDWLLREGIEPPRLYKLGFPHNNCGGFCIKAGQAHFLHLMKTFPERFAYHEAKEQEIRKYLDADVSILRDRRGGEPRPLTLRELRKRHESGDKQLDFLEWGGCGCAF